MTINLVAGGMDGICLSLTHVARSKYPVSVPSAEGRKEDGILVANNLETQCPPSGSGTPCSQVEEVSGCCGEEDSAADSFVLKGVDGKPLNDDEQRRVKELQRRDKKVRAHEQAHMAAGAGVVQGGAHYQYRKGPDGVLYAVGGEVSVDTSEGRTSEETLRKMEQVKAAALAPSDPSPQDRRVAADASAKAAAARAEIVDDRQAAQDAQAPNDKSTKETEAANGAARCRASGPGTAKMPGRLVNITV